MIKIILIVGIIIILLSIALALIYTDRNVENFTIQDDAAKLIEQRKLDDEADKKRLDNLRANAQTQSPIQTPAPAVFTPISTPATPPATPISTPATPPATPVATPISTPSTPISTPSTPISTPVATKNNIVDFLAVISAYKPWGVYYAGRYSENKLNDLLGREDRNAIVTGTLNSDNASGFGANGTIKSVSGTINTYIEWSANSIPEKFTICSITRYTGINNNKRILTARNATVTNDWIHGHKGGKRGVVYYTDYKTNSSPNLNLTGNNTDWVVTCAKNDIIIPNNVIINGVPSGIKSGGQGGLRLSINKLDDTSIIAEQSDFAMSYIIIWDINLTNTALKIVSDALMNYLNTGEDLLFDTNNLSADDKIKVIDTKTNFLKDELNELTERNNMLVTAANSANSANSATNPDSTTATATAAVLSNADKQVLYSRLVNLENTISGKTLGSLIPTTNVINLNLQSDTTDTTCANIGTIMPEPTERSFIDVFDDNQLNAANTNQRPYIWCKKCNANDNVNDNNSSSRCIAYNVCKTNYAKNNKDGNKSTFTTISDIDKEIYYNCSNAFINFPRYLDINSILL